VLPALSLSVAKGLTVIGLVAKECLRLFRLTAQYYQLKFNKEIETDVLPVDEIPLM